jgi:hypothetical protein
MSARIRELCNPLGYFTRVAEGCYIPSRKALEEFKAKAQVEVVK